MKKTHGVTLLEVLIVIVIASSVLVFALPAYKRTQDRSLFLAAQGLLVDLGSAVRSLQADLRLADSRKSFPKDNSIQLVRTWQNESSSTYSQVGQKKLESLNNDELPYALFAHGYLQPVRFDSPASNEHKKYTFFICPQNQASTSNTDCCNKDSKVVACMQDADACTTRATKGLYKGARFMKDGSLVQVTVSDAQCAESQVEEQIDVR
ncbi:MAG: type II secretion system GspH family protein [Elusimicrobiaceae bacterium]|nr:type II secretion system GspH family protein [Elusimicrobiaceae bacterium]